MCKGLAKSSPGLPGGLLLAENNDDDGEDDWTWSTRILRTGWFQHFQNIGGKGVGTIVKHTQLPCAKEFSLQFQDFHILLAIY